MGGRDHSTECEVCGEMYGGLQDLDCACTAAIPHTPGQPCCVCADASWCECGGCPECKAALDRVYAELREPVGDVPDDGAIAEIVASLERGES